MAVCVVRVIHLVVKLLIDNYLIVTTCLRLASGKIDMKAAPATPPAWKHSLCTRSSTQL